MKKFFLSFSVIGAFVIYSFHQNEEGNRNVVLPPVSVSPAPTSYTPVASGQPPTSTNTGTPPSIFDLYKDGSYTGSVADAFYGNIQVQAVIQNGKITDVQFLQYPNDRRTSIQINTQAMPYLKQEAIAAQNANVDTISGATDTSMAFRQSFASALSQAK